MFFNPALKKVKPYIAGKAIEELARESGFSSKKIAKLASNENALGPSPKALVSIRDELDKINRYPDSNYYNLRKKLSAKSKLDMKCIVLGNGSDELIDCCIKAFSACGDEVLSAKTTFLEYEIIAKVNARKFKAVSLKNFRYDLERIRKAITKKTRLIFIANPNNPTGTYVNRDEVRDFLKKIPRQIVVVFDEAYNEFIDVDDFPDTLNYLKNYNILILRTFSKSYGLAGLRIGFAISRPEFATILNKVRQPFNVNCLAQAAALAAVDDSSFLKRTRKLVWQEKAYLYRNLKKLKVGFIPTVANFILIDIGKGAGRLFYALLKKGIIVRPMSAYGLDNFIRVTIGKHQENVRFIKELEKVK